jgi:DNA-binding CsgD family transcriptional regulator
MNNYIRTIIACTALLFFAVLFLFSGAAIRWLIDLPTAIALVVGTFLITCLRYKKGMAHAQLQNTIQSSLLISSVITLSTGVIGVLSLGRDVEFMIYGFGVAFITVPYTLVLWVGVSLYFYMHASKKSEKFIESATEEKSVENALENSISNSGRDYSHWQLTPREIEIVEQLLLGKTNREIGESLFISETTVKRHLANVFVKANVSNRQALMAEIHHRV